jgi:hypothetical protein
VWSKKVWKRGLVPPTHKRTEKHQAHHETRSMVTRNTWHESRKKVSLVA